MGGERGTMAYELVARTIAGTEFRYASEADLQEGIAGALVARGWRVEREVSLTPCCRIDLMVGSLNRVGVEVKVNGSIAAVSRQLRRYAECEQVGALVLVTNRVGHRRLPDELCGKPLVVVVVGGVG